MDELRRIRRDGNAGMNIHILLYHMFGPAAKGMLEHDRRTTRQQRSRVDLIGT
jgi:hypothetical protein